jgi:hypothetical protein
MTYTINLTYNQVMALNHYNQWFETQRYSGSYMQHLRQLPYVIGAYFKGNDDAYVVVEFNNQYAYSWFSLK